MAAKKKPTKPVKKVAAKKAPVKAAPKKGAAKIGRKVPSPAVEWLQTLPHLTDFHRHTYKAVFTDEQCLDWGTRTKAVDVLADANRCVGTMLPTLRKGLDGYPLIRVSWLCWLLVQLEDSIADQQGDSGQEAREKKNATVALASDLRKKLGHKLSLAGHNKEEFLARLAERNEDSETPSRIETSITGMIQLALQLRRSDAGELLANGAGLTEAFLSQAAATVDQLSLANRKTWGTADEKDSTATNVIEGRVLRELNLLRLAVNRAIDEGVIGVQALPALATLDGIVESRRQEQQSPAEAKTNTPA